MFVKKVIRNLPSSIPTNPTAAPSRASPPLWAVRMLGMYGTHGMPGAFLAWGCGREWFLSIMLNYKTCSVSARSASGAKQR